MSKIASFNTRFLCKGVKKEEAAKFIYEASKPKQFMSKFKESPIVKLPHAPARHAFVTANINSYHSYSGDRVLTNHDKLTVLHDNLLEAMKTFDKLRQNYFISGEAAKLMDETWEKLEIGFDFWGSFGRRRWWRE